MQLLTVFTTLLVATVAHGASANVRRAAADVNTYPELAVRAHDGTELSVRDTSPAKVSELLGRACCYVCAPKGSDNCGCCGICC